MSGVAAVDEISKRSLVFPSLPSPLLQQCYLVGLSPWRSWIMFSSSGVGQEYLVGLCEAGILEQQGLECPGLESHCSETAVHYAGQTPMRRSMTTCILDPPAVMIAGLFPSTLICKWIMTSL
eukprot:340991-Amphidinium_carterae.1